MCYTFLLKVKMKIWMKRLISVYLSKANSFFKFIFNPLWLLTKLQSLLEMHILPNHHNE